MTGAAPSGRVFRVEASLFVEADSLEQAQDLHDRAMDKAQEVSEVRFASSITSEVRDDEVARSDGPPEAIQRVLDAAERVWAWVGPGDPDLDDPIERERFMDDVSRLAADWFVYRDRGKP